MIERRVVIRKYHLLSMELEEEYQRIKVNAEKDKNESSYLDVVKNIMRSRRSFSTLFAIVPHNYKSEVN